MFLVSGPKNFLGNVPVLLYNLHKPPQNLSWWFSYDKLEYVPARVNTAMNFCKNPPNNSSFLTTSNFLNFCYFFPLNIHSTRLSYSAVVSTLELDNL